MNPLEFESSSSSFSRTKAEDDDEDEHEDDAFGMFVIPAKAGIQSCRAYTGFRLSPE